VARIRWRLVSSAAWFSASGSTSGVRPVCHQAWIQATTPLAVSTITLYLRQTGEWLGDEVHRDVPKIEQLAPLVRAAPTNDQPDEAGPFIPGAWEAGAGVGEMQALADRANARPFVTRPETLVTEERMRGA
jgi:hypothetical protein